MSDTYHLMKPPVDIIIKPIYLSHGLMQAGKSTITHNSSSKSIIEPQDLNFPENNLESIKKHHNSFLEAFKLELEKSNRGVHNSERKNPETPRFISREKCRSEVHFSNEFHLPKIQSTYLTPLDKDTNSQFMSSRTPTQRKIYHFSSNSNPSRIKESSNSNSLTSLHRKTIVLDLDETLIHASPTLHNPDHMISRLNPDGSTLCIRVNIRPYAKDFLRALSSIADIIIFTAGIKSYADAILSLLDPNNQFIKARYYRDSCIAYSTGYIKDLKVLNKDLRDVLIIDNLAVSFSNQQENGILISS